MKWYAVHSYCPPSSLPTILQHTPFHLPFCWYSASYPIVLQKEKLHRGFSTCSHHQSTTLLSCFTGCFFSTSFVGSSILYISNIRFLCSDLEMLPLFLDDVYINFSLQTFPQNSCILPISLVYLWETPQIICPQMNPGLAHKNCCLSQLYKRQICHFSTQIPKPWCWPWFF